MIAGSLLVQARPFADPNEFIARPVGGGVEAQIRAFTNSKGLHAGSKPSKRSLVIRRMVTALALRDLWEPAISFARLRRAQNKPHG